MMANLAFMVKVDTVGVELEDTVGVELSWVLRWTLRFGSVYGKVKVYPESYIRRHFESCLVPEMSCAR